MAAEEVGALVAVVEAIDADLAKRGRDRKALLDARLRASGRLHRWLDAFGATPASRAALAAALASGSLGAEIQRRIAEARGEG